MLVRAAATEWQSDVAREVTIQIRPAASRDMEADVARAAAIARTILRIADVRPFTKEEAAHLLEPWLGTGLRLDDLPVPRIIVVRIAHSQPARFFSNCAPRLPPRCRPRVSTIIAPLCADAADGGRRGAGGGLPCWRSC